MPAKVNPVMTEMVSQVAFHVMCGDQAITMAAASGQLELNAFLPLTAFHLLGGLKMLANAALLLRTRCIDGITADEARCRRWLEESLCLATVLVPYLGYDGAAELSRLAGLEGKTIREKALETGAFTDDELNAIFASPEVTRPGIAGARKVKKIKGKALRGRSDAE
jgi:aspartate ammonia-lyase